MLVLGMMVAVDGVAVDTGEGVVVEARNVWIVLYMTLYTVSCAS